MATLPDPLPAHPRLFLRQEDFSLLVERIQTDVVAAKLWKYICSHAETFFEQPVITRELIGRRMLTQSRCGLFRITSLALVGRVQNNRCYIEKAINEMLAAASFTDWNPSHFLDVAEMATAVAIGYDWLHEFLTPEQEAIIRRALVEKAILPSIGDSDAHRWWTSGTNNWNQVCNAGIVVASLAIAEDDPTRAEAMIQRALKGLPNVAQNYAPDGVYPEGPMYWSYGTLYHAVLTDALYTATGAAHGTDAYQGLRESADYVAHSIGPSGDFFNFGDCRTHRALLVPLFWFAAHYKKPEVVEYDVQNLDRLLMVGKKMDQEFHRLIALAFIWWCRLPQVETRADAALSLNWCGQGPVPIAFLKTPQDEEPALYVAIKGGTPSFSHAHMDVGSFVLEADGVRWAVDPGMEEYHALESLQINLWQQEQEGMRWKIFRLGPDSHSIPRFNGRPQLVKGHAEITRFTDSPERPQVEVDLSEVYADSVRRVTRLVEILEDKTFRVEDTWEAGEEDPVAYAFQWMTEADTVEKREKGVLLLKQKGASLRLEVEDIEQVESVLVDDVSKPREYYDAANPGLKRITILCRQTQAGGSGRFGLRAVPGSRE